MPLFVTPQIGRGGLALRCPSVDGQPGDLLGTDGAGNLSLQIPGGINATNRLTSTIFAGQVCAIHSSGLGFVLANASDNTLPAIGLARSAVAAAAAGSVQTSGLLTLTDWTAVTGTVQLAARSTYWLDINSGKLTNSPPAARGNVLQAVGQAVGPLTLLIDICPPILL
jgi:hypothetical protein